jgi:hypothetical protein
MGEQHMNRIILALVFCLPSALLAQTFTYAPINVPGAVATEARAINNNGEIVGFYKDTPCTDSDIRVPNCPNTKGFKLVNGSYIKLMVPGSSRTAIMGVNDLGDLVGFYTKSSNGTTHGFIWYHTNTVRTIDYPGVANATVPFGINKAGTVVGGIWGTGPDGSFPSGGWVLGNGTFSNMNPSAPNAAAPCCWSVTGISNNGILSGLLFQSDFFQAWMKEATDQDFFKGCCDTSGLGVNNNVDMIGYTIANGWFTPHIESNEGSNDSIKEVAPTLIPVVYPGATSGKLPTYPFGINDLRAIVGAYIDSTNQIHGFLAKPNF